ncbi:hypothetical protein quinque_001571 [Culex quinquefasciatus]
MATTDDVPNEIVRSWINVEYFTKVLKAHFGEEVKVLGYALEHGAPKGQNFMSSIIRAKVTYCSSGQNERNERSTISVILKTGLESPDLAESVQYVFEVEKDVYGTIMGKIRQLLESSGDCGTLFGPKLIYEDDDALVLEDLSEQGFKQPDRRSRLDLDHCKLLMLKLAKFHAATAVLSRKNRNLFELHMTSGFYDEQNPIRKYYQNCVKECTSLAATIPDLASYEEFFIDLECSVIERECSTYYRDEDAFNVLNHGDLWLNNVLWKYDTEGKVIDLSLIDYQECFFGSPGIDLNHFLYTSANNDVQRNGFDDLVQIYVTELRSSLRAFKYDATLPTLETIQHEMHKKRDHALVMTTCIVPALIIERTELATPENMLDDSEEALQARREVFTNPKFVEILKFLLPKFAGEE